MKQKPYLLLMLMSLPVNCLRAQDSGRMETDRPDQTESPFITKKHYLQAELGINAEKDNHLHTFVHPTVLWKYGLASRFELRLITELVSAETPLLIPYGNDFNSGLLPVQIGGKLALAEEKGLLPKTSLIFHLAPAKLASRKFKASKWAPNFRFTMQNTVSEKIGIGYNLGAEWDGETTMPYWIYTLSPGFNLGKKWYGYIEAFGSIRKDEPPQHAIDGGLAYYFSDNTKIDISGGAGISKAAIDNYIAIGFSWRFKVGGKK